MCAGNLGYLYYKDYYKKYFMDKYYKHENKDNYFNIENSNLFYNSKIDNLKPISFIGKRDILHFKTVYPGLLIGSGYNHIVNEKNEFKLGFEFDYTTGLPIISGSSVKGLLRSAFYNEDDCESLMKQKLNYINELMNNLNITHKKLGKDYFKELTYSIFEGKYKNSTVSIYDRDIFYESVIDIEKTKKEIKKDNNKSGEILGDDFITPHKNPLKNPIPIKFLKVLPNVVWRFQFDLNDNGVLNISGKDKLNLFGRIIFDLGIGAKTNVGYGRFDEKYVQYESKDEK